MATRYSSRTGYTVTKRRQVARRQTVHTTGRRVKLGPTTAKFLGLGALGILAIVMISQSSSNATTAYKQNEIRSEVSQNQQDIDQLELEAKRAQSLQAIQQTPVKDQMEQATSVDQVEVGDVAGVSTESPSSSPTP